MENLTKTLYIFHHFGMKTKSLNIFCSQTFMNMNETVELLISRIASKNGVNHTDCIANRNP